MASLPPGPFDLLYVDFPLYWRGWSLKGEGRSPQHKYRCPSMEELIELARRFGEIAAPDAVMASWIYGPRKDDNELLIREAGFTYKSWGFVWLKVDKNGNPLMGCGKSTRKETECVLLYSRGKGLPRKDFGVREFLKEQRGELPHQKPEEVARRLERLYGDVRRVELFARRRRPGWEPWGDELAEAAA